MICACLDLSVLSSSWCLGRAAICDCVTPWTFLLPCFECYQSVQEKITVPGKYPMTFRLSYYDPCPLPYSVQVAQNFLDLCCLDLSVLSSSWCLGRAAICDCVTPWTFLLPFF